MAKLAYGEDELVSRGNGGDTQTEPPILPPPIQERPTPPTPPTPPGPFIQPPAPDNGKIGAGCNWLGKCGNGGTPNVPPRPPVNVEPGVPVTTFNAEPGPGATSAPAPSTEGHSFWWVGIALGITLMAMGEHNG